MSSTYHSTGALTLFADNGAIFIAFAAAFLGTTSAITALVLSFFLGILLQISAPLEPLLLVFAALAGLTWSKWARGQTRKKFVALAILGAFISLAMLPAYIWPQQPLAVPLAVAIVAACGVNLALAVMFGSFIGRERNMLDAEMHLQQLANTDQLTGLHNRRTLISAFEARSTQPHGQALMLIDVDNFKSVNDAHGHSAGDQVLRHISQQLQNSVRTGDIISRFGGEEFAVLMHASSLDEAAIAGDRLRAEVEHHRVRIGQLALPVTVSVGVAWWSGQTSFESQFVVADGALYRAKREGRNCVRLGDAIPVREPAPSA